MADLTVLMKVGYSDSQMASHLAVLLVLYEVGAMVELSAVKLVA